MNKYIFLFIFAAFASSNLLAQNGWILQNSRTRENLRSISSSDGVNVMAVGKGGIILLSTDQGINWQRLQSPTQKYLNGVAAISGKDFCIVGPKDTIYYTNDRGISWHAVRSNARGECGTRFELYNLTAIDYDSITHTLCVSGNQGEVVFSADSGKHWVENSALDPPLSDARATDLTCISSYNGTTIVAGETVISHQGQPVVEHFDFFYTSSNQGELWTQNKLERFKATLVGDILIDMFGCDIKGWTLVGGWLGGPRDTTLPPPDYYRTTPIGGTIYHSQDYGKKWDSLAYGSIPPLRSVHFGNEVYGYLCGDNGFIMGSVDGGSSWKQQQSPVAQNLHSVHFSDPFHGFICGDSGVILTTQDGGIFAGVKKGITVTKLEIYPNPFLAQTTINFDLSDDGYTKLTIYDLLGNQRAIIADGNLESGSHSYKLNSENLSSGMYICILEAGGKLYRSQIAIEK
jgi:photosystem II stability/assembly factor-like uncharacterized protein